jgi:alpha-beta hydrolase superfamily lysophospholipase
LQHSKVDLSWDTDDHRRTKMMKRKFNKDEIRDMDFRAYLANSDDSSEDDDNDDNDNNDNNDNVPATAEASTSDMPVIIMPGGEQYVVRSDSNSKKQRKLQKQQEAKERYRKLLSGISSKNNDQQEDMEITFTPGFSEVAKNFEENKQKIEV